MTWPPWMRRPPYFDPPPYLQPLVSLRPPSSPRPTYASPAYDSPPRPSYSWALTAPASPATAQAALDAYRQTSNGMYLQRYDEIMREWTSELQRKMRSQSGLPW